MFEDVQDAERTRKRPRLDAEEDDSTRPSQLVPDDIANFLKLCEALQILMSGTITEEQIEEADQLIRQYGLGLIEVCILPCTSVNLLTPCLVAVWSRCLEAKSSLRDSCWGVRSPFRAFTRLLDISF